ncbi:hypothetical protein C7212DRAFT_364433 [Tuber magnatum]|uniref:Endonuclease/exonuclease/phosphatase domain-containing protein n=1 Tax=Tuber magnatum TaxID=42249 RepID=A0A317SVA8_9PEZI|nr:hypothetical protein C7212DRAFT_364433 [Tuber magnatum]
MDKMFAQEAMLIFWDVILYGNTGLVSLDIQSPNSLLSCLLISLWILNGYSTVSSFPPLHSLILIQLFSAAAFPLLVLENFNIYHPLSDLMRDFPSSKLSTSTPYFTRASDLGFSLLNTSGEFTRFPFRTPARPGVLDLTFANHFLALFFESWSLPYGSTGLDHVPVPISFSAPFYQLFSLKLNWPSTDWVAVKPLLATFYYLAPPFLPSGSGLDVEFEAVFTKLTHVLIVHTPSNRPYPHSKPW